MSVRSTGNFELSPLEEETILSSSCPGLSRASTSGSCLRLVRTVSRPDTDGRDERTSKRKRFCLSTDRAICRPSASRSPLWLRRLGRRAQDVRRCADPAAPVRRRHYFHLCSSCDRRSRLQRRSGDSAVLQRRRFDLWINNASPATGNIASWLHRLTLRQAARRGWPGQARP